MTVLSIHGLNLTINGEQRIKEASFEVASGDVVLLTGPNGCGKSTVIKIIMGAIFKSDGDIAYNAQKISYYKNGEEFNLKEEKDLECFRRNVCYISQEDEFEADTVLDCFEGSLNYSNIEKKSECIISFIRRYSIAECFGVKATGLLSGKEKAVVKRLSLKGQDISTEDEMAIKYLSMSVRKMSGGQKKLTNIFTNLIRYEFSNLLILDEPLNNLDYSNVRAFSNVLTRIHKAKPELAILLVTHCRSIPIVNKVIEIHSDTHEITTGSLYICNSCFGVINKDSIYT